MLLSLFQSLMNGGDVKGFVISLLLYIPTVVIALTVHEYCHGYAAYKCGDDTAYMHGRLTLNPMAHFSLWGSLMMLVFGFGFAKPVPISPRKFKNFRWGMFFVAIAGPLSNLLLALIGVLLNFGVLQVIYSFNLGHVIMTTYFMVWQVFINGFIMLNIRFAVFNLFPVPPFDGSRIIFALLPPRIFAKVSQYENYILLIVFVLLYLGYLEFVISFFVGLIYSGLIKLVSLLPFTFV